MPHFLLTLTLMFVACSSRKSHDPTFSMAFDSLNDNKLQATAIKRKESDGICIDISVISKSNDQRPASWKVVWIDEKQQEHKIKDALRAPASQNVWKNDFTACESNVKFQQVKALVLTPESNHEPSQKLQLRW